MGDGHSGYVPIGFRQEKILDCGYRLLHEVIKAPTPGDKVQMDACRNSIRDTDGDSVRSWSTI